MPCINPLLSQCNRSEGDGSFYSKLSQSLGNVKEQVTKYSMYQWLFLTPLAPRGDKIVRSAFFFDLRDLN